MHLAADARGVLFGQLHCNPATRGSTHTCCLPSLTAPSAISSCPCHPQPMTLIRWAAAASQPTSCAEAGRSQHLVGFQLAAAGSFLPSCKAARNSQLRMPHSCPCPASHGPRCTLPRVSNKSYFISAAPRLPHPPAAAAAAAAAWLCAALGPSVGGVGHCPRCSRFCCPTCPASHTLCMRFALPFAYPPFLRDWSPRAALLAYRVRPAMCAFVSRGCVATGRACPAAPLPPRPAPPRPCAALCIAPDPPQMPIPPPSTRLCCSADTLCITPQPNLLAPPAPVRQDALPLSLPHAPHGLAAPFLHQARAMPCASICKILGFLHQGSAWCCAQGWANSSGGVPGQSGKTATGVGCMPTALRISGSRSPPSAAAPKLPLHKQFVSLNMLRPSITAQPWHSARRRSIKQKR